MLILLMPLLVDHPGALYLMLLTRDASDDLPDIANLMLLLFLLVVLLLPSFFPVSYS